MEPQGPNLDPSRPRPAGPSRVSRPDGGEPEEVPYQREEPRGGPSIERPEPEPPRKSGGTAWVAGLVLVAVMGLGYLFMGGPPSSSAPAAPQQTQQQSMLAAETQSPEFAKHRNRVAGARVNISMADLDLAQTQAAIDAAKAGQPIPNLTGASPDLVSSIAKGDVKFYRVRAYDTCAEDGDWVTVSTSNGAKVGSFMLTKVGTTVTIPVVGGQVPNVQLTADRDGVGGVTVGVVTSEGTWYSGVLDPGQSEAIPMASN